jgi:hypothetical protein
VSPRQLTGLFGLSIHDPAAIPSSAESTDREGATCLEEGKSSSADVAAQLGCKSYISASIFLPRQRGDTARTTLRWRYVFLSDPEASICYQLTHIF